MFIQISICLLYYCIYTAKIVNKLRIHQFYSLNPQKYISSIHSPLKNTQKHQVYTLARRFFHSFFPSERWFAYLRKDQSGLPWCQKPLYFLTFSTPLLCHQGYTLNMAWSIVMDDVRRRDWWVEALRMMLWGGEMYTMRVWDGCHNSTIILLEDSLSTQCFVFISTIL